MLRGLEYMPTGSCISESVLEPKKYIFDIIIHGPV